MSRDPGAPVQASGSPLVPPPYPPVRPAPWERGGAPPDGGGGGGAGATGPPRADPTGGAAGAHGRPMAGGGVSSGRGPGRATLEAGRITCLPTNPLPITVFKREKYEVLRACPPAPPSHPSLGPRVPVPVPTGSGGGSPRAVDPDPGTPAPRGLRPRGRRPPPPPALRRPPSFPRHPPLRHHDEVCSPSAPPPLRLLVTGHVWCKALKIIVPRYFIGSENLPSNNKNTDSQPQLSINKY